MEKPATAAWVAKSRIARPVVRAAPISTTNITGFFIRIRGCSLRNESPMARRTMGGSNNGRLRGAFFGISEVTSSGVMTGEVVVAISAPEPTLVHQEML